MEPVGSCGDVDDGSCGRGGGRSGGGDRGGGDRAGGDGGTMHNKTPRSLYGGSPRVDVVGMQCR